MQNFNNSNLVIFTVKNFAWKWLIFLSDVNNELINDR